MSALPQVTESKMYCQQEVDKIVNDAVNHQKCLHEEEMSRITRQRDIEIIELKTKLEAEIREQNKQIEQLQFLEKKNAEAIYNLSGAVMSVTKLASDRR